MSRREPVVDCPLCGARFEARASCPSGCPLSARCATACCPECGYRFPVESRVVEWVRRVLGRRTA